MKNLPAFINRKRLYNSKEAYNLWSQSYDDERDNLMLYYDKIILNTLLSKIDLYGKTILDYGCGTGRNWNDFLEYSPGKIIGCDVSAGMLNKLESKFANAEKYLITNDDISFLENDCCDVIVSTLVIAHIKNIESLFAAWKRILKKNGSIIITDFHPKLLDAGGLRTFKYKDKSIAIKNYIHTVEIMDKLLSSLGFEKKELMEKYIDEDVKHFYEKHNALHVYNQYKGLPFIYGMLLTTNNAD